MTSPLVLVQEGMNCFPNSTSSTSSFPIPPPPPHPLVLPPHPLPPISQPRPLSPPLTSRQVKYLLSQESNRLVTLFRSDISTLQENLLNSLIPNFQLHGETLASEPPTSPASSEYYPESSNYLSSPGQSPNGSVFSHPSIVNSFDSLTSSLSPPPPSSPLPSAHLEDESNSLLSSLHQHPFDSSLGEEIQVLQFHSNYGDVSSGLGKTLSETGSTLFTPMNPSISPSFPSRLNCRSSGNLQEILSSCHSNPNPNSHLNPNSNTNPESLFTPISMTNRSMSSLRGSIYSPHGPLESSPRQNQPGEKKNTIVMTAVSDHTLNIAEEFPEPLTIPDVKNWKDVIDQWYRGNPEEGLRIPLKFWTRAQRNSSGSTALKAKFSLRKLIVNEWEYLGKRRFMERFGSYRKPDSKSLRDIVSEIRASKRRRAEAEELG